MTHYSIAFRTLSNDMTGIAVNAHDASGAIVARMNVAAAKGGAIMVKLNEIRRTFLARGIEEFRA